MYYEFEFNLRSVHANISWKNTLAHNATIASGCTQFAQCRDTLFCGQQLEISMKRVLQMQIFLRNYCEIMHFSARMRLSVNTRIQECSIHCACAPFSDKIPIGFIEWTNGLMPPLWCKYTLSRTSALNLFDIRRCISSSSYLSEKCVDCKSTRKTITHIYVRIHELEWKMILSKGAFIYLSIRLIYC